MSIISAGTSNTTSLVYTGDTTGNLAFQINGTTEAMRITSAGAVGIGTSNPAAYAAKLAVYGSGDVQITTQSASTGSATSRYSNSGDNFWVGTDNSSGGNFGAGAYGRVLYSSGAYPMIFYTNDVERIRIPSDASGIKFPTSQVASSDPNTLDDYEEGTWTPQFETGSTQPGSLTYVNRGGNYTKIGRYVIAWFYMNITVSSSGSGNPAIVPSSLPFARASDNLTNSASTRGGFVTSIPNTNGYGAVLTWNNANPANADALYMTNATCGGSMTTGAANGVYAGYIMYEST